ncbi:hypothetical protein Mag101_11840 [Microbulbifer agarilyticus]|uniref:Di-haem cytochrome c peroxidase domain-containing protein n=1 Tax=Microbulbifer agarilyticus TaxID=260552 RepID=A0A1Q2M6B1_9GAMM|nr:hypothetical protein Mag101_11840 [Microbulbifer agarilyticus]
MPDSDLDNGSPSGGDSNPPIYALNISTTFFKGPVKGADCVLFSVNDGEKADPVTSSLTGDLGVAHFGEAIDYDGIALIECSGGVYFDEATDRESTDPTPPMRSVVSIEPESGSSFHFVVTPLTEIATQLAQATGSLDTAVGESGFNAKVAAAFGLQADVDVTTLVPRDLLLEPSEIDDSAEYAFVLAVISASNENDREIGLDELLELLAAGLAAELEDGNTLFSASIREELGAATLTYTDLSAWLSFTQRDIIEDLLLNLVQRAELIVPETNVDTTDSIDQPFSQTNAELVDFVISKNLQPVAPAPNVSDTMYMLGQALAFDKILSGNRDISCLSCHHPLLGSGDARSLPLGTGGSNLGRDRVGGKVVARHAMPLFNLDLFENMFWDGRIQMDENGALRTPADQSGDIDQRMLDVFFARPEVDGFQGYGLVAAQAMFPVANRAEMRGEVTADNELAAFEDGDFAGIWNALMGRLGAIPEYVTLFEAAYPDVGFDEMTFAHAANAIAAFEIRGFDKRDNPWQRFIRDISADGVLNDPDVLTEAQIRGAHFFYDTGCDVCHAGSVMSDFDFHNLPLAQFGPGKGDGANGEFGLGTDGRLDFGRERVTGQLAHRYQFRTQPLFNVELTAPYGHLGQFSDLSSHVQIYATPRQFWIANYMGYNTATAAFDQTPDYVSQVSASEQALFTQFNPEGLIRTDEYRQIIIGLLDDHDTLSQEEGKVFGAGNLTSEIEILVAFLRAQTDPAAEPENLRSLIPESVPSGLPVESGLIE